MSKALLNSLNERIIGFQRNILELKKQIKILEENNFTYKKKKILTEIEWSELIFQLTEDVDLFDDSEINQNCKQSVMKSLQKFLNKIEKHFESESVVKIEPNDLSQDLNSIKIIETWQNPDLSDGVIAEIVRPGYKLDSQILRKAEVITIRNK
jgi:molecular chaperone GrpE (heat shock protein)